MPAPPGLIGMLVNASIRIDPSVDQDSIRRCRCAAGPMAGRRAADCAHDARDVLPSSRPGD
jgi:hypothetical protein